MKRIFMFLVILAFVVGGVFVISGKKEDKPSQTTQTNDQRITVLKSPSCGCCVGYSGYLKNLGYDVEVQEVDDMTTIKSQHKISTQMQSCHTSLVGDYFVEGHVPIEVVEKLLEEKPDIDGIALPGMPAGSPGMPGAKTEEFVIYSLNDGEVSEFMKI